MSLVLLYISDMLRYMITLFPIYCVGRYIYCRKTRKKVNIFRELILGLFALYIIGLASQTIIPEFEIGIYANTGQFYFDIYVGMDLTRVNLIPFRTIYSQLFTVNQLVDNWNSVAMLNLTANVLLFVPIGVFLPILWKKWNSIKKIMCIGLMTTCLVEFIQLFIGRSVDIDDIILNTFGVLIGYGVYVIVLKLVQSASSKLK